MNLLHVVLEVSYITSESIYILSECHLPLGADWSHAGKYGVCAS